MEETVPVLAGVVCALLAAFFPALAARKVLLALLGAVAGATWSVLIGEASESWAYVLIDALQAVAAFALVTWAARRARTWRSDSPGAG